MPWSLNRSNSLSSTVRTSRQRSCNQRVVCLPCSTSIIYSPMSPLIVFFLWNFIFDNKPNICKISAQLNLTRESTYINIKFKSNEQTNIDKNRVAANIAEYHIKSKLIFRRIIIPKFMMSRAGNYFM